MNHFSQIRRPTDNISLFVENSLPYKVIWKNFNPHYWLDNCKYFKKLVRSFDKKRVISNTELGYEF